MKIKISKGLSLITGTIGSTLLVLSNISFKQIFEEVSS